ncbi:Lipolytic enzyme, G-D-S-L [Rubellimicrobium mesophilum DSM 19309]|uniref:Lipolytic enzyme, G-D-S-L n=1 Tax=Rubellimicrobium mesophilum DSM 19309 TaxID=442562 RepID=A0A017HK17_9RHOB|nr:SGNH/GDSL hydrolase family protein [Rubellimicrobium mesophilum]EYD74701.1 Lipolytic enzyme, G-D-S-L [Rubellimicrobium mesophilum DSM 19309]
MPTLLCFGDSNTHGSPPIVTRGEAYWRFDAGTRWTRVLAGLLPDWEVVEEGLPGRTAQFPDPVMGSHMDGREGLKIALQSHGPIDALTVMLGTNDVKTRFGATAEKVTAGIAGLLDIAMSLEMQERHGGFKVLVICPPPVLEQGPIRSEFSGAREASLRLPALYRALAEARGVGFLDAGSVIEVSPTDGIHFEPEAHKALGAAVAEAVRRL